MGHNLVLDLVPRSSPGLVMLAAEFLRALNQRAPAGSVATLMTSSRHERQLRVHLSDGDYPLVVVNQHPISFGSRLAWHRTEFPRLAQAHGANMVYSMTCLVSPAMTRQFGTVTTVNNMTLFSPTDQRAEHRGWWQYAHESLLRRFVINALKSADQVVLHSHHALRLVARHVPDIANKTRVVLTGVPADIQPGVEQVTTDADSYFLYFSTVYPYKNHIRLVRAYADAAERDPTLPRLVLAGTEVDRDYANRVRQLIDNLCLADRVQMVGELPRTELLQLIHGSTACLFASTCETNSVALTELLGAGAAIACSNVEPMPEVVDGAAHFFDPFSETDMAECLLRLYRQPQLRQSLKSRALARAAQLSWLKCGDAIWDAAIGARQCFEHRRRTAA